MCQAGQDAFCLSVAQQPTWAACFCRFGLSSLPSSSVQLGLTYCIRNLVLPINEPIHPSSHIHLFSASRAILSLPSRLTSCFTSKHICPRPSRPVRFISTVSYIARLHHPHHQHQPPPGATGSTSSNRDLPHHAAIRNETTRY